MTEPCVRCGVDSVATCRGCGSRVCNRDLVLSIGHVDSMTAMSLLGPGDAFSAVRLIHPTGDSVVSLRGTQAFRQAWSGGEPRCVACRTADGERANAAVALRVSEEEARRDTVADALREVRTFAELAAVVRAQPAAATLPVDAVRVAWAAAAAAADWAPDCEVVQVERRRAMFGPKYTATERVHAWRAELAWRHDMSGGDEGPRWKDVDLWLDVTGACWEAEYGGNEGGVNDSGKVVLPLGSEVRTERRPPAVVDFVLDGVRVVPVRDDDAFLGAIRAILAP